MYCLNTTCAGLDHTFNHPPLPYVLDQYQVPEQAFAVPVGPPPLHHPPACRSRPLQQPGTQVLPAGAFAHPKLRNNNQMPLQAKAIHILNGSLYGPTSRSPHREPLVCWEASIV